MSDSNFVSSKDVVAACQQLGIRDWSATPDLRVSDAEAQRILDAVGGEALNVAVRDFREGLQVELEHGTRFPDANVTNNHPILTGKIVLAHLKESLLYYKRLMVAELEGDLLKATKEADSIQIRGLYVRVVAARLVLNQAELAFLGVD